MQTRHSPLRVLGLIIAYTLWLGLVFVAAGVAYLLWAELGCPQTRSANYVFEGNPEPGCARTRGALVGLGAVGAANAPWLLVYGVRRARAQSSR